MRKLAKIRDFLCNNAWLSKLCIGLLFLLWATNLYVPIMDIKFGGESNSCSLEDQHFVLKQLYDESDKIGLRANELGVAYKSENYFKDFRTIQEKRIELSKKYHLSWGRVGIDKAHNVYNQNILKRLIVDDDFEKARDDFDRWEKANDPIVIEREKMGKVMDEKNLPVLLHWGFTFYWRGFLLALFFYLLGMYEEKGVVRTILSDKKRFAFALIVWPYFLLKYPKNVVRYILVEAELRRMGNAFRRLSDAEKQLILAVANGTGFHEWIFSFRKLNAKQFKRSLICALLLVLVIHLFLPTLSGAHEASPVRAGPGITMHLDQQLISVVAVDLLQHDFIPENIFVCISLPIEKSWLEDCAKKWTGIFVYSFDHVPL